MCSPTSHCQQSSCMEKVRHQKSRRSVGMNVNTDVSTFLFDAQESKDIDRPHEQLDPQALSVLGLTSRNAILKSLDATVSPSSLSITVSRRSPPPVFFPPAVRSAIGSRTPHSLETSPAGRRSVPTPEDGKLDVTGTKGMRASRYDRLTSGKAWGLTEITLPSHRSSCGYHCSSTIAPSSDFECEQSDGRRHSILDGNVTASYSYFLSFSRAINKLHRHQSGSTGILPRSATPSCLRTAASVRHGDTQHAESTLRETV